MMSGTTEFQPPEQLMAQVLDEQADIYAFGVLLIELYGVKAVWAGLTPYQIMVTVVSQENFNHSQILVTFKSKSNPYVMGA